MMEQHRINQLPVVVDGKLVGIVTDRDLRDAFPSVFDPPRRPRTTKGPLAEPERLTVEAVMTPHVLSLSPSDSMSAAAQLMRRERMGSIPVVDHGHLVGILTRSDLLEAFIAVADAAPAAVVEGLVRGAS